MGQASPLLCSYSLRRRVQGITTKGQPHMAERPDSPGYGVRDAGKTNGLTIPRRQRSAGKAIPTGQVLSVGWTRGQGVRFRRLPAAGPAALLSRMRAPS